MSSYFNKKIHVLKSYISLKPSYECNFCPLEFFFSRDFGAIDIKVEKVLFSSHTNGIFVSVIWAGANLTV